MPLRRALWVSLLSLGCAKAAGPGAPPPAHALVLAPTRPASSAVPSAREPTPPGREELVQALAALRDCNERPYVDREIVTACRPYLTLWRGRMESVDLLVSALSDERRTLVFNFSGQHYTVSDLARSLLMDMIPDLPIPESVLQSPRTTECGECALWDYLARPGARAGLTEHIRSWLAQHRGELEWERIPGSPVDGRFRLRD